MKPRVAIIDDHTLFAAALRKLLEADCDVVGSYDDPRTFLLDAAALAPDVVIVDVSMPSMSGLDVARELRRRVPDARIIFVTMNEDPQVVAEAFRLGASGYLLKNSAPSELHRAIREVMNRHDYVTPLLARSLAEQLARDRDDREPPSRLTPRQREVLQLLAKGRSMKEAAAILNISVRTVAFHKYRMMEHLDIDSTAELIRFAVREGLA
jgi:DNA-binding NarL/FixJ family response regulator